MWDDAAKTTRLSTVPRRTKASEERLLVLNVAKAVAHVTRQKDLEERRLLRQERLLHQKCAEQPPLTLARAQTRRGDRCAARTAQQVMSINAS
jgi:hypothetical protein